MKYTIPVYNVLGRREDREGTNAKNPVMHEIVLQLK